MPLTKRSKPRRGSDAPRNGDAVSDADSVHSLKLELEREVQDAKAQTSSIKSQNRHWYLARKWIFPLGIFLGVLLGFALVQPGDLPELPAHLSVLLSEYQDTINIPQIIDFSRFENEWQRFRTNIPEVWKLNTDGREFQVGEEMKARGLSARYPIVLVPGIISTALESWSTEPPYREQFRVKVWGGFPMIQQVMFNREKWMHSMLLDPVTGLDPPGVKVRAAEGISAASSFIQGYWLWSKIVENLAVVNYDTNNLFLAPYDWRLSYHNLEVRDGYFSKLKANIEGLVYVCLSFATDERVSDFR